MRYNYRRREEALLKTLIKSMTYSATKTVDQKQHFTYNMGYSKRYGAKDDYPS